MTKSSALHGTTPAEALTVPDRGRPDAAEAMIRLEPSRDRFAALPLPEVGGQPRPAGSVTLQLPSAGRYCVEVAIPLRELPADERVAVVGTLDGGWRVLAQASALNGRTSRLAIALI
ncbi:phospho-sugar glycosidase domain-containing protein [Curtobacterium sp. MCJR17_020]|uniref:phospho-sugar glycosidase domain-containing protein n=1 Tax=Curtobacterium sp. MCJR17_020 TaxID=2175619 RepID=UPI000DA902E8|nr:phospho-sugar glycosidase domain-containing protein [Curtobacterium sp. MCJR17_020]WIE73523.1 DUF871 family protein [Curtobacterium sp. MCJR17_020]